MKSDKSTQKMVKEDQIVGMWVRLKYPDQFEEFLKRAKLESTRRRKPRII